MSNNPECKARTQAARYQLVKKRRSSSKSKNKNKKKATTTDCATLAQEIAAALKAGVKTPEPAAPTVGIATVPPVIQVPQGLTPFFNTPLPRT